MDKQIESCHAAVAAHGNTAPEHAAVQDPVRMAAMALGKLPKNLVKGRRRTRRTWTGFIAGTRMWVGRVVILPNGTKALIKCIWRGFAKVQTSEWDPEGFYVHRYLPVSALEIAKNPDAVLLGAQKRGKVERKSQRKADAARRNGAKSAGRGKKKVWPGQAKALSRFLKSCI